MYVRTYNYNAESSGDVHTENKQDDASDKSIDQTTSDTVRSKEGNYTLYEYIYTP